MSSTKSLSIRGARENNLKTLNLDIPHDKFVVLTGLSGSGKSSLAFDTIYAEGGRRYIETFSPYTRQFLDRLHKPDVDSITNVRPALALEQRNSIVNARSTVGTVTEINDYLKVVWAQAATAHCPNCSKKVTRDTPRSILERTLKLADKREGLLAAAFPVSLHGEASLESIRTTLQAEGFIRFYRSATGTIERLDELTDEDINAAEGSTTLLVIVDRLSLADLAGDSLQSGRAHSRLLASLHQAYEMGSDSLALICISESAEAKVFEYSNKLQCSNCKTAIAAPKPSIFSYNSPIGACGTCSGFGKILKIDRALCVPDKRKSIEDGAVVCWSTPATEWEFEELLSFCERESIPTDVAWKKLPQKSQDLIFDATRKVHGFTGILAWFKWLERKKYKMHVRVFLSRYRSESTCPDCGGSRLKSGALLYTLGGKKLPEIWSIPLDSLLSFFEQHLSENLGDPAVEPALLEVTSRLRYLCDVGLGYLTLDRQSKTLSGGEHQRVNLTTILGARLVNTTLVLDEPSIGLHPRDTARLLRIIRSLRDRGNTVLVVEHEEDVIRAADHVIDLGPNAGSGGGSIIFSGTPSQLAQEADSHTGRFLRGVSSGRKADQNQSKLSRKIEIKGACAHNLKGIDVEIPLGGFTCLTGVSGSGKSTLAVECLIKPYEQLKNGTPLTQLTKSANSVIKGLKGIDSVSAVVLIDQSPVGKSPRSNSATYTKAWDIIRECLASTDDAVNLGLSKSAFSFNVDGGRCPECSGAGYHKIEMQFLADVYVECEACGGLRFTPKVQTIRYGGKSVTDFLAMTLDDTVKFFEELGEDERAAEVVNRLTPLLDLGLGYLTLGQPLSKLSGGEAQRVKLASYLQSPNKERYLFVLDEPTTGLHAHDVQRLIQTLRKFTSAGHSILCIEHNTEVIRQSDWIIDLGPEGGEQGGEVVASGDPRQLLEDNAAVKRSYTLKALAGLLESAAEAGVNETSDTVFIEDDIAVVGARHHNLKNITARIPRDSLSVITGVSGSGKSSLAFDIVFAEGQRRYIDSLSPYARQFIKQLQRPDVDAVSSLPPTVAISQKTAARLGLSTIATTSEIYQYLRLLFAKVGSQHCPDHDKKIVGFNAEEITDLLVSRYSGKRLHLFAPVVSGRKGFYTELFNRALRADIIQARVDGKLVSIEENMRLERHKLHYISLLVASAASSEKNRSLLLSAVEQCLLLGNGTLEVSVDDKKAKPETMSTSRMCPVCKRGFAELDPQDFSFSSSRGVCETCSGKGELDSGKTCPDCGGARIKKLGRHVYIGGEPIHKLAQMTAPNLLSFIQKLSFDKRLDPIVKPIFEELEFRLDTIQSIGLDYLQLDRDTSTLSGGEAQRLRLARSLGSPLTGVAYVLDEPTIGLHPHDHEQLMQILFGLRDAGNTVIVVEHDEETIRLADHIIDMGPGGGSRGGRIVSSGTIEEILADKNSPTGKALRARTNAPAKQLARTSTKGWSFLELKGASANNLKRVNAKVPLGKLTVVAGVSGAGKSSLVHQCLIPAVFDSFGEAISDNICWDEIRGDEAIERFVEIDQSPIGRTPSSCPGSYLKVFDDIRAAYAKLPDAIVRGWGKSHFSYNTSGGRCEECAGKGFSKIPMSFLPEAVTICESCGGSRYNDQTLELCYQGVPIGKLLQMTMDEVRELFRNHPRIRRPLDYVHHLGLGYLTLGQPTYTLSGGEAQRLKIAKELGSREAVNTLYVLDEPTTGLHMSDIDKLLSVLFELIKKGNTVVVIEHNLDVIRAADYLIELGPGPGERGGKIVFSGTPSSLASSKSKDTATKAFISSVEQPAKHGDSKTSGKTFGDACRPA
ncbi:MAG: excinuclease ABC subunit UvrA [Bdellovibrionales bacterium]|nr:excinuclease ABC subunit UvrA [Bdellovibrionales bacterium]